MSDARHNTTNYPWITNALDNAVASWGPVGGIVKRYKAGAILKLGDVVYHSATDTVNKSNTAANYQAMAGVVVGWEDRNGKYFMNSTADVGLACASGDDVFVCYLGVAWVVADAATTQFAKISQGATTAGRVDDGAGAAAGQTLGIALDAATNAADVIRAAIHLQ